MPFPGWETLASEAVEGSPRVLLVVRDASRQPVRVWSKDKRRKACTAQAGICADLLPTRFSFHRQGSGHPGRQIPRARSLDLDNTA